MADIGAPKTDDATSVGDQSFQPPPFPPPLGRNGEEIPPGGNFGEE